MATAPGPDPANSCYGCLFNYGCIDDAIYGDQGLECEDPLQQFGTAAQCHSVIACILGSSCASAQLARGCYCGSAPLAGACQGNPAPGPIDGSCASVIASGLGFPVDDGTDIVKGLTNTTRAAGRADQIFQCAIANQCTACLQ